MAENDKIVGIEEAAKALGISADTVRRHIKDKKLQAKKVQTKRGPRWKVTLPNDNLGTHSESDVSDLYVNSLLERIKSLEAELAAKRADIQQLYGMLSQKALPLPNPWWKRIFK